MQIEANTPGEMRDKIVKWLKELAVNTRVEGMIANRKRTHAKSEAKADALSAAATFIQNMEIKSHAKPKECPNCGEELI